MKFKVEITTDNAAFEGSYWSTEVARILRTLAIQLEEVGRAMHVQPEILIRDINGNTVGKATTRGR